MTIHKRVSRGAICVALAGAMSIASITSVDAAPRPAAPVSTTASTIAADAAAALASISSASFGVDLERVAYDVAMQVGVDAGQLSQAWAGADRPHQIAMLTALTQVGVPYRRNTSVPGQGFDCSGLTSYAWGQAGLSLPRQSGVQIRQAAVRTRDTAQAGDLVYYPGHVMLWLGVGDVMVHAPYSGRNVEVGFIAKKRAARAKFGNPLA